MPITVLQEYICVKHYLYYGFVLFIALVLIKQGQTALGQTTPQQDKAGATQQAPPEPTPLVSPPPSQTAVEQAQPSVEAQKSSSEPASTFWDAKLTDWIQVGINVVLLLVVFWQAKINRDQRITMQRQNEIMQGELDITRDSVKQSERALLASETQAKAVEQSVVIAKESFYVGERPYFGITGIDLTMVSLNMPRVEVAFGNGGRTPAWHFHALVWIVLGDNPQSDNRWSVNSREPSYAHRYFPVGQRHAFVFFRPDVRLTPDQLYGIQAGTLRLFVVGTAHYNDMRGRETRS